MLYNGGGRVSDFPEKSVTKMYGSMLLALREGEFSTISTQKSIT